MAREVVIHVGGRKGKFPEYVYTDRSAKTWRVAVVHPKCGRGTTETQCDSLAQDLLEEKFKKSSERFSLDNVFLAASRRKK